MAKPMATMATTATTGNLRVPRCVAVSFYFSLFTFLLFLLGWPHYACTPPDRMSSIFVRVAVDRLT